MPAPVAAAWKRHQRVCPTCSKSTPFEDQQRSITRLTTDKQYRVAANDLRRTPPVQPGESNGAEKLPSFSEFIQTTRTQTPPHTPSRRNGSVTRSPREHAQFDESFVEMKRRRVDKRTDSIWQEQSYSRAGEPLDSRRARQLGEPAPLTYSQPHEASFNPSYPGHMQQHRPSVAYAPVHSRHHSVSSSNDRLGHHSHSGPPNMLLQSGYTPPPTHSQAYDHRQSYYGSPAPQPGHGFAPSAHYVGPPYNGAPYHGYDSGYSDIRFQQHMGVNPDHGRKRRGNLPKEATNLFKDWYSKNRDSPYPTEEQKLEMCELTGLSMSQVANWFINARRREPEKERKAMEFKEKAARETQDKSQRDAARKPDSL
ncbi:hypothetical protein BKA63DRAFT_405996 [Paraphoma chrysanthemicola]|nr:hypothetical protein BKA63DRAFT_405996 [Paraphoma chrysanthemicola]